MSIRKALGLGIAACLAAAPLSAAIPAAETTALRALYDATGGGNWTNKTGWLGAAGTECSWFGVTCGNGNTTVVGLNLAGNNLVGTLPAELQNLTNLTTLHLGQNNLGTLPASLGNVTSLEELNLDYAGLTGPLPPELGNLVNLNVLSLAGNRGLTGAIPVALGGLASVETIILEGTLTGSIPATLANLSKLTRLDLNGNKLSGSIPPELSRLASLENLSLYGNQLTGGIPKELGGLSSLQGLSLGGNPLGGAIPEELGNLKKATGINIASAGLTGQIPAALGGLPALEYLDLSFNALTGPIPKELGDLPAILDLRLYGNQLSGSLPAELGKAKTLVRLSLFANPLTGQIPDELGGLTSLVILELGGNGMTGPIPASFNSLVNLEELGLGYSHLSGTIPSLTSLTHLKRLGLNDNNLTGSIPADLGRLPSLGWLDLHNNTFSGSLPAELGSLSHLGYLDASGNNLTGSIPRELGSLSSLTELHLEGNQLSGAIPSELGNLTALAKLSLQNNQLTGGFPSTFGQLSQIWDLNLSGNQIGGALPPEIGGLSQLLFLYLSGNQFRSLPAEIGRLTKLRYLMLDGNLIAGSIPRELGNLADLEQLNLQANQLTGSIPAELGSLKKLTQLLLNYNQLTGAIPPELGAMTALEWLVLGSNQLSGSIPAALGSLKAAWWVDLSQNALTGTIPAEIGGLTSVAYLSLNGNMLSGALPSTLTQLTTLNDGSGLDLSYNALHTEDPTVRDFVNKKWWFEFDRAQTIAPPGVTAPIASTASVTLRWNPILYQDDAGGYEVLVATGSGTPTVGARTGTKSVSSATVANLTPGTAYTFSVRTVTSPNNNNPNTVTSEPSASVTQSTTPAGSIAVALSPANVRLLPGTNASMAATITPAAATALTLALYSSNTSVATVPATVSISAGATTATFAVTGRNYGTTVITASLPASVGGGSAAADVTVAYSVCIQPNTPSFNSTNSGNVAVRAGNSISLTWTASLAQDPGGTYQVDVYPNSDCRTGLKQYRVQQPALSIPTAASQAGSYCFVVRAISSQGCASGDSSHLVVAVQPGPAAFVALSSAPLAGATSLNVPPAPAKVVFKNIGFSAATFTVRANLGFGTASPTSFPNVPPGGSAEVTLTYDPLSTTARSFLQGSLCGVWNDGGEKTVCAAATLTVFDSPPAPAGPAARPQVVGVSEVHFITPPGGTPPTQTITLKNPSAQAIRVAPGIAPGGTWLTVAGDVLTAIPPGGTRDLTLSVDRTKRATTDGAPPVSTQLYLTNVDGPDGDRALVTIFDEEPPPTTSGSNRAFLSPDTYSLILGSSVNASGSGGTIFLSDGWVRNKAPIPVIANLYYTPSDTDGIGNPQVRLATITLQPYSTYRLSDFVRGLFGTSGSGSVEIRSDAISDLSVRTTVDALTVKNGSVVRYGAEIPTIQSRQGVSPTNLNGASLLLPGLRGGAGSASRTNVILTETSGRATTVALRLFGSDGTLLGERNVTVPPYSKTQVNAGDSSLFPAGASVDGASLEVKPVSGAGSVAAFATVIDNASQGYTTRAGRFLAQALSTSARRPLGTPPPTRLAIPTAAHASGQNNSFYTTAVSITNGVASPASLTLKYITNGQAVATAPVTIPARATVNYQDVIATLFGISDNTAGMIFVEGDIPKVVATSDTSTPLDPSQASLGLSPSTLSAYAPESSYALGDPQTGLPSSVISHPALEESTRFRTNLILAEVSGSPTTVRVRIFPPGSGGVPLAEKDYTLGALQRIQETNFMVVLAGPGQYLDYETTVEWVSGAGRVLAVATKIDNDPGSKRADVYVLGPTGGLQGTMGF